MNDLDTTLGALKGEVHALCLRKGWGVDGVQNQQRVAMAMTVEVTEMMSELRK